MRRGSDASREKTMDTTKRNSVANPRTRSSSPSPSSQSSSSPPLAYVRICKSQPSRPEPHSPRCTTAGGCSEPPRPRARPPPEPTNWWRLWCPRAAAARGVQPLACSARATTHVGANRPTPRNLPTTRQAVANIRASDSPLRRRDDTPPFVASLPTKRSHTGGRGWPLRVLLTVSPKCRFGWGVPRERSSGA